MSLDRNLLTYCARIQANLSKYAAVTQVQLDTTEATLISLFDSTTHLIEEMSANYFFAFINNLNNREQNGSAAVYLEFDELVSLLRDKTQWATFQLATLLLQEALNDREEEGIVYPHYIPSPLFMNLIKAMCNNPKIADLIKQNSSNKSYFTNDNLRSLCKTPYQTGVQQRPSVMPTAAASTDLSNNTLIDISGLDKVAVLDALYSNAYWSDHSQRPRHKSGSLDRGYGGFAEAITRNFFVQDMHGVPIRIDFSGDFINAEAYDCIHKSPGYSRTRSRPIYSAKECVTTLRNDVASQKRKLIADIQQAEEDKRAYICRNTLQQILNVSKQFSLTKMLPSEYILSFEDYEKPAASEDIDRCMGVLSNAGLKVTVRYKTESYTTSAITLNNTLDEIEAIIAKIEPKPSTTQNPLTFFNPANPASTTAVLRRTATDAAATPEGNTPSGP